MFFPKMQKLNKISHYIFLLGARVEWEVSPNERHIARLGAVMSVFTEGHRVTPTAATWTVDRLETSWCPPGQCSGCPHHGVQLVSVNMGHLAA